MAPPSLRLRPPAPHVSGETPTLSADSKTSPETAGCTGGERFSVVTTSDEQNNHMAEQWTAHHSRAFVKLPGWRAPMTNLGLFFARDAMMQEASRLTVCYEHLGTNHLGDPTDLASVPEDQAFWNYIHRRGEQIRFATTSNHVNFFQGVAPYGLRTVIANWGFGTKGASASVLGELAGGKDRPRTVEQDIHAPAAGGPQNILNKVKSVSSTIRNLHRREPEPVTLRLPVTDEKYMLGDGRVGSWSNTGQVVRDFWRQERDGSWTLHVRYEDGSRRRPEERELYASVVKRKEIETPAGRFVFYDISFDTMDYGDESSDAGSERGFVARAQARLQEAIKTYLQTTGNAWPFFIGDGHYTLTDIFEVPPETGIGHYLLDETSRMKASGLDRFFSDDSVIAYNGAHRHRRGFVDVMREEVTIGQQKMPLAMRYGLTRRNPLPVITNPAVIDYPMEISVERTGVDPKDPYRIVHEIRFVGIDESRIEGETFEGRRRADALVPRLLPHLAVWRRIKDPRFRQTGSRFSSWLDRAHPIANAHDGITFGEETGDAELHYHDTLHAHTETAKVILEAMMNEAALTLGATGLNEEAAAFEESFGEELEYLNGFYDQVWRGDQSAQSFSEGTAHAYEGLHERIAVVLKAIRERIAERLRDSGLSAEIRYDLENLTGEMRALHTWLWDYGKWIQRYRRRLRDRTRATEMIKDSDLFAQESLRDLWGHIQQIRPGSPQAAFMTRLFLHSSRLWFKFRNEQPDGSIPEGVLDNRTPDVIRIEIATDRQNAVTVVADPLTREVVLKRFEWWNRYPSTLIADEVTVGRKTTGERFRGNGIQDDAYLLGGILFGRGADLSEAVNHNPLAISGAYQGFGFEYGHRWHASSFVPFPWVNGIVGIAGEANYRLRRRKNDNGTLDRVAETLETEFPLKAAVTTDFWTLNTIELGPMVAGGLAFRPPEDGGFTDRKWFVGPGWRFGFLEGALTLEGTKRYYTGAPSEWHGHLSLDLYRLDQFGRFFSRVIFPLVRDLFSD